MDIKVLKVAKDSNINAVSVAALEEVVNSGICHLDAMGVSANYVLVKALILIVGTLESNEFQCNLRPYYVNVPVDGTNDERPIKTAIRWTIMAKR
ncbi:stage V sporulation protein S [Garciella nitratireducens]|uniref:stage V sporulation protein S n=1 Tax=Garciella nitratireducens TaxID=218205 RepID=UPI001BD290FF|nr:stage V sporulation protein S [Garciella nitratireducens]